MLLLGCHVYWVAVTGSSDVAPSPPRWPNCATAFTPGCVWASPPPADCPLARSTRWSAVRFGAGRNYEDAGIHADTWYPSWADDGELYTPFEDGTCQLGDNNSSSNLTVRAAASSNGWAILRGDDALKLEVVAAGSAPAINASAEIFARCNQNYVYSSLVSNGVWYLSKNCQGIAGPPGPNRRVNALFLGWPLGSIWSTDRGASWSATDAMARAPLFGDATAYPPPSMVAGRFVDFGQGMRHSPDGKAYVVASGASVGSAPGATGYATGDRVTLGRVALDPSRPDAINNPERWEFFAGRSPQGFDRWSKDAQDATPVFEWKHRAGPATLTYHPESGCYLLAVAARNSSCGLGAAGWKECSSDVYIAEASSITGPYKLVSYMQDFGPGAYFPIVPSKFLRNDGSGVLMFSAFDRPAGSSDPPMAAYSLSAVEFQLLPTTWSLKLDDDTARQQQVLPQSKRGDNSAATETPTASQLNAMMALGTDGGVYTGGTGVIVRDPFDGYENSTSKLVVPASFLVNDIVASGTVFPPCNDGEAWPDLVLANLVVVIGSKLSHILHGFDSIQSNESNANVFYPADSNAVDDRCRWLPDRNGYDCPFGKFLSAHGGVIADPSMQGAGSFAAGNRQVNESWGGGAGCHFSAFDTGAKNLSINQVEATDAEGRSMVEGRDCQCNTAYRQNWDAWIANFVRNGSQLGAMNNPMDRFQCWTTNLRDMILLQNAIFRQRRSWATKHGHRTFTGNPPFGVDSHSYYGWNEIPVPRIASGDASNWDGVAIKLPPDACNRTTSATRKDTMACLGHAAQDRLEANIDRWVLGGLLVTGEAALTSQPGSRLMMMREVEVGADTWIREFYCETWHSPSGRWRILATAVGECYLVAGSELE